MLSFEDWFAARHAAIPVASAKAVLALSEGGATLPFIARYRKEQTGNLDEVAIQSRARRQGDVGRRRAPQEVHLRRRSRSRASSPPSCREKILATYDLERLEDLYLPYKLKRKTKATVAREAGLEPLARWMWQRFARGHGARRRLARREGRRVRLAREERRDRRAGHRGGARHRHRAAVRGRRSPRARAPRALRRGHVVHQEGREGQAEQQVRALLRAPRARRARLLRAGGVAPLPGDAARVHGGGARPVGRRRAGGRGVRRAAARSVRARRLLAAVVAGRRRDEEGGAPGAARLRPAEHRERGEAGAARRRRRRGHPRLRGEPAEAAPRVARTAPSPSSASTPASARAASSPS